MNRGALWILFVVVLLAGNAVAAGVLVVESGDPTSRVLPDYYKKAVTYDATMATQRQSLALGWVPKASLGADRLEVALVDRDGAPVAGASVTATVHHRSVAFGGAPMTLTETAPGRYAAPAAIAGEGLFVVDVTATRAADTFVAQETIERAAAGPATKESGAAGASSSIDRGGE